MDLVAITIRREGEQMVGAYNSMLQPVALCGRSGALGCGHARGSSSSSLPPRSRRPESSPHRTAARSRPSARGRSRTSSTATAAGTSGRSSTASARSRASAIPCPAQSRGVVAAPLQHAVVHRVASRVCGTVPCTSTCTGRTFRKSYSSSSGVFRSMQTLQRTAGNRRRRHQRASTVARYCDEY